MQTHRRNRKRIWLTAIFYILLGGDAFAESSFAPDWNISGQSAAHLDYYDSTGPEGSYRNEGFQFYNDLNVQFQNTANPYNTVKGYFTGTYSDSLYRNARHGFIPERFNLNQENGEFVIPYRLDLGDYHAFQTPRTLQRSLKGGQIELQPGNLGGADHSLLMQSGTVGQDYHDSHVRDEIYTGASWLMNWKETRLAFNYVNNQQASQAGMPTLYQSVFGASFNTRFAVLNQQLELDADWNYLQGSKLFNGTSPYVEGQGRFAQLNGRSKIPLTYNLRYEEYDPDYIPRGGMVSAGRRSIETRAGWQGASGYSINGRGQFYRDGEGTAIVTNTDVFGLGINGALPNPWIKGLNGGIDVYRQHAESTSSDTVINSLNANVMAPLPAGWSIRLYSGVQETAVQRGVAGNTTSIQGGADVSRALVFAGFTGMATAGFTYSGQQVNERSSNDFGLNFSSSLTKNSHRMNLSYRHLQQDRQVALTDNKTQGINVSYEYTIGRHTFRIEGDNSFRQPENNGSSVDTRVAITWTYSFDRPAQGAAGRVEMAGPTTGVSGTPAAPPAPLVIKSLADLKPGLPMDHVLKALSERNIKNGVQQGRYQIFDTVWFDTISQRQRLVLSQEMNYLARAAIIVEINQVGELETLGQLYERLHAQLIRSFGAPTTQNTGNFGPNVANDLRTGAFVRISDWKTPSGFLRLGIPRRLDGMVRIEIQHAESFPMSSYTSWGLEEVR